MAFLDNPIVQLKSNLFGRVEYLPATLEISEFVCNIPQPRSKRLEELLAAANKRPAQTLRRESANVAGINTASSKSFDKGYPVTSIVIRHKIDVSRYDRSQVVTKVDIDRRTIVECTDTRVQNMLRRFRRFRRKPVNKIGMKFAFFQNPSAAAGDTQEIADASFINRQKGVEDSGDQDCAARVRLCRILVFFRFGIVWFPLTGGLVHFANRVA